jgi:beta-glucosidase
MRPWPLVCVLSACTGSADTDPPAETPARDPFCPAGAASVEARLDALLPTLSLEQKVGQMAGGGVTDGPVGTWSVRGVPEAGVPGLVMVDGPRGLHRAAGRGTAFPVASARGATWDPALERRVGAAIGEEVRAVGASVVLAPTINLLRHPRWGRAQETYGEDPTLLGELGAAFVLGAQEHVVASVKHLAANSIEDTRFDVDVQLDERTLHELYLPAFHQVVTEGGVGSVMAAYNKVNGAYCAENRPLLRDILKDDWGFRGFVESDWVWGVYSTAPSALAGLDLEMPTAKWFGDDLLAAVQAGEVPESVIDEAVRRLVRVQWCHQLDERSDVPDPGALASAEHVALAREVATRATVLLKNDGVLPLDEGAVGSVLLLGPLADADNIGDNGSSAVDPPEVITLFEGLQQALGPSKVDRLDALTLDVAQQQQVLDADAVVLVVGLTRFEEGEGRIAAGDRASLDLPEAQRALVQEVAALRPDAIVVLQGGSAIVLDPWVEQVGALLMAWYPGMHGGHAIADLLLGRAEPSGRLPVSFPRDEADLPAFDNVSTTVQYDLWHGYRHLLRNETEPRFAFGHGLSYTTWSLGEPTLSAATAAPGARVQVQVQVQNTGERAGRHTVQLYAEAPDAALERSPRWLVGFAGIELPAGGAGAVTIELPTTRLAAWDPTTHGWTYEPTTFDLRVGSSVVDVGPPVTLTVSR